MHTTRKTPHMCILFALGSLALVAPCYAGGVGITLEEMPADSINVRPMTVPFHYYRIRSERAPRAHRDLEFFWSDTYDTLGHPLVHSDSLEYDNDLARMGDVVCEVPHNPFGFPQKDIALAYNYLNIRIPGRALTEYNVDPQQGPGFYVCASYDVANRSHVDAYIFRGRTVPDSTSEAYDPEQPGGAPGDAGNFAGAAFPSDFITASEDTSTGIPADSASVLHANSIMLAGPPPGKVHGTLPTGWARVDGPSNAGFLHEFTHCVNQGLGAGGVPINSAMYEMFGSAAEAIVGEEPAQSTADAPYTWSLLDGSNYQAWRSFTAYLAYNFRGIDQTASGISDDVLARWAANADASGPTLEGLGQQLASGACAECDSLEYFGGLSGHDRLQVLIHNWRVANYVNDTSLAESQYGFPGRFGFIPSRDVGAWQDLDGKTWDNGLAIPPEVTVFAAQRVRELNFSGTRGSAGCVDCDRPMTLVGFGAEYWVIKSDPSLTSTDQDLVIRVAPEGTMCTAGYIGRLMASAILYSQATDTLNSLWRHPEWAESVIGPVSIDQGNRPLASPIELVVPHFGSSTGPKSVVVVVTLEEGPTALLSSRPSLDLRTTLPYSISVSLPSQGCSISTPIAITSAPDTLRRFPVWSPTGQEVVFMALDGDNRPRIYRKSLAGGSAVPLVQPSPGYAQFRPDWSPRGDWICYEQANVLGKFDLWIHNVVTGETRRVFGGPTVIFDRLAGSFSPNGQELAYLRVEGSVSELHRVNLDGSGDSLLATYPTNETPRWSPQGDLIYLRSTDAHAETLLTVPAAAGGVPVPLEDRLIEAAPFFGFDLHPGDGPVAYGTMSSIPPAGGQFDPCFPSYQRVALLDTANSTISHRFTGERRWSSEPRWGPDGVRLVFRTRPDSLLGGDVAYGYVGCNRAPTLATLRDTTIEMASQFALDLTASDPDGDAITFRDAARYRPFGATFNPNGQFRWTVQTAGDHYLVFRALDDAGGVSSQVVKVTVVSGGSGCPFADTKTVEGWQVENSILGRSATGTMALDAYRLKATPSLEDGLYRLRLRENERELTTLDEIRLVAVDHAADLRPYPIGDRVVLGTRVPPYRVTTQSGEDVTALVNGNSLGHFEGRPGDTLLVELIDPRHAEAAQASAAAEAVDPIEMDIGKKEFELQQRPGSDLEGLPVASDATILNTTGILMQGRDASGVWQTVRHRYPRANFDEAVIDTLDQGPVRLVFVGAHALRFVGRVIPAGSLVTPQRLDLVSADHSRLGVVRSALLHADGATTTLMPGDTLELGFAATPLQPGQVRDFFLLSYGVYTSVSSGLQGESANDVPASFALLQNQPNPFTQSTTIRFELPQPAAVRLDVFDLQGRLLRRLADGSYPPGRWSATWDRSDSRGNAVPPAVYLYRMTAGPYRGQKKMVLLP